MNAQTAVPRTIPDAAFTGKAAPAIPQIRNLARIPVGLQTRVGVRYGLHVEYKQVVVAATWLDRLGNRWYAGTLNNNAFVLADWKLEALLSIKQNDAEETSFSAPSH